MFHDDAQVRVPMCRCRIDGFFTDTLALRSADPSAFCSHGCNHVARALLRACGTFGASPIGQPASIPGSTTAEAAMVALLPRLQVVSHDAVCPRGANTSASSEGLSACVQRIDAFALVDTACAGISLDSVDCDAPCLQAVSATRILLGPCFASLEELRVTHAISGSQVFLDEREASRTLAIHEVCVRRAITSEDVCTLKLRRLQEAAEQGICNLGLSNIDSDLFSELRYRGCFTLMYDMARHCSWLLPSSPAKGLRSTVAIAVLSALERWPLLARFGDGFGLASAALPGGGRLYCALMDTRTVEAACSSPLSSSECPTACYPAVAQLKAMSGGCFPVLLRAAEASVLRAIAHAKDRSSAMFWRPDCISSALDGTESCRAQWLLLVGLQNENRCKVDGIDPNKISSITAQKLCDDGCTDVFAAAIAACRGLSANSVSTKDRLEFEEFNRLVAQAFIAVMIDLGVIDRGMALSFQGKSAEYVAAVLLSFNINADTAGVDVATTIIIKNARAVAAGNNTAARAVAYAGSGAAELLSNDAFDSFLRMLPLFEAITPALCTRSDARCNSHVPKPDSVRFSSAVTSCALVSFWNFGLQVLHLAIRPGCNGPFKRMRGPF